MWNKIRRPLALWYTRRTRANIPKSFHRIRNFNPITPTRFAKLEENEAYGSSSEYVVLNYYAPRTTDDWVVNGPLYIQNGLHSLVGTFFAAYGIDVAFGCHGGDDESFIFCRNLCAKINKILEGPKTIRQMFPFFKGTEFEGGVDAAFES
ncbi:hemopexin fold protein [Tanacetum coccineum]